MKEKPVSFQQYIEDQLSSVPGVRFRRMFGGYGIYGGEIFFGIIHSDRLYFHTDDQTVTAYKKAGSTPFVTPGRKKQLKSYYEVPVSVAEHKMVLTEWALTAIKSNR